LDDLHSIIIRNDIRSGDIGYLIYLHGLLYSKEYDLDIYFESYVAIHLSKFAIEKTDIERIWIIEQDRIIKGSIAIVKGDDNTAQLRWYLLHPDLRGIGLGKKLINEAIAFSRENGYKSIFLWTLSILTQATRLYESAGFRLTEEITHNIWGRELTEQRYDLSL